MTRSTRHPGVLGALIRAFVVVAVCAAPAGAQDTGTTALMSARPRAARVRTTRGEQPMQMPPAGRVILSFTDKVNLL